MVVYTNMSVSPTPSTYSIVVEWTLCPDKTIALHDIVVIMTSNCMPW